MKSDSCWRAFLVVFVTAVVLRFALALMSHPSGDAAWHLSAARFIARNLFIPFDQPLGRFEPFWPAPLFHVIAALFYKLLGDVGMKLVSPLFGSLSLLLSYLVVRKLFNSRVAFFSILFLSFIPIYIYHSALPLTESVTAFMVLLSLFLLLENRYYLSALSTGLLLLTKPTAIFAFPVLLLLIHRNYKEDFVRKTLIFFAIAFVIALPWYLRNYALFGNPVWPYLNIVFNGMANVGFEQGLNPGNLLNLDYLVPAAYLETFGVPNGDFRAFSYLNFPFKPLILAVWFIATLAFSLPLLLGFFTTNFRDKNNRLLLFWLLPFLFFITILLTHFPMMNTRYLLPIFPVLAVFWANGLQRLVKKLPLPLVLVLLTFCISIFVVAEFVKAYTATAAWNFYKEDFNWIKGNAGADAVVYLGNTDSQTFGYNLDKPIRFFTLDSFRDAAFSGGYIFVNQQFKLDAVKMPPELYRLVKERFKLVYENTETKTEVYYGG